MNVLKQRPLFSGQLGVGRASICFGASAVSPENEGTRITRVVQDVQRPAMHEFCPHQLAFVGSPLQPSRKQELFLAKALTTAQAEPLRRNASNRNRILSCTWLAASGIGRPSR